MQIVCRDWKLTRKTEPIHSYRLPWSIQILSVSFMPNGNHSNPKDVCLVTVPKLFETSCTRVSCKKFANRMQSGLRSGRNKGDDGRCRKCYRGHVKGRGKLEVGAARTFIQRPNSKKGEGTFFGGATEGWNARFVSRLMTNCFEVGQIRSRILERAQNDERRGLFCLFLSIDRYANGILNMSH